jgi:hypothetical protein
MAGVDADIGWLDMEIAVEIGGISMQALAYHGWPGQPTKGKAGFFEKEQGVFVGNTLAVPLHFGGDSGQYGSHGAVMQQEPV